MRSRIGPICSSRHHRRVDQIIENLKEQDDVLSSQEPEECRKRSFAITGPTRAHSGIIRENLGYGQALHESVSRWMRTSGSATLQQRPSAIIAGYGKGLRPSTAAVGGHHRSGLKRSLGNRVADSSSTPLRTVTREMSLSISAARARISGQFARDIMPASAE